MRVLVTGHNGFIGSVLVPVLRDAGHEVVGLDSFYFAGCRHGPPLPDVPAVRVDLRDVEREHVEGVDAVVHLAALSNDPLGDLEPEHTYDINYHSSVRLAELAKAAGVSRFLYSSSCSIYGAASTDGLVDEKAPMNPVTPYADSKVKVEADLHALADGTFSPTSLRNATAYGWSPQLRVDIVLNDLVGRALLTGKVEVLSDGTPWRPIVHVEDIARAFLAILESPREPVHDEAINIGTETDNHQVKDLAAIVADTVPDSEVFITGETGPDPRSYRVSFAKLRARVPDFACRWDARMGARQLYDAYREHGMTEAAFNGTYRRLRWLTGLLDSGRLDDTLRWREAA